MLFLDRKGRSGGPGAYSPSLAFAELPYRLLRPSRKARAVGVTDRCGLPHSRGASRAWTSLFTRSIKVVSVTVSNGALPSAGR
jgi:hypothetical protein